MASAEATSFTRWSYSVSISTMKRRATSKLSGDNRGIPSSTTQWKCVASAEFIVHGTYLATDPGVPAGTSPARGQSYTLPAGAFFELRDGKVARISNHYNLSDWIAQVNA